MNDREREDRILIAITELKAGLAEVKGEIISLATKQEQMNGSVVKHFADDLRWQEAHDLKDVTIASDLAVKAAVDKGFRKGLLWPLGIIIATASVLGPTIVRIILGG